MAGTLFSPLARKLMVMKMKMKKIKNKVLIISSTIEQNHLTEDLILEILSRLPPITLLRFKSVSKTWYSLISNPGFLRRHTALYLFRRSCLRHQVHKDEDQHELSPPGILLGRHFRVGDLKILILPPPPPRPGHYHQLQNHALLLQNLIDYCPAPLSELLPSSPTPVPSMKESFMLTDSCNGLLLYVHSITRKEEEKEIVYRSFYVCNPITKDYIKLPTIDIVDIDKEQEHEKKVAQIVFNPSFSLTYKVFTWIPCVKGSRSDSSNYYRRLYVYSSETRSWRLSVSIPITEFPLLFCFNLKAVLWNGVLHWTTFVGGKGDVSLCYDIEKETVWTMKFPKMATGYTRRILFYFGECGGRLLMIEKHYRDDEVNWFPSSFDVMEKKQQQQQKNGDGEDDVWTVRYRVNFEEVDNDYYCELIRSNSCTSVYIFDIYRTMRTNKGGEEEEMLLMKVGSDRIISFNLTSNTFGNEELRNRKTAITNIGFLFYTDILRYTMTLYPP